MKIIPEMHNDCILFICTIKRMHIDILCIHVAHEMLYIVELSYLQHTLTWLY